MDCAATQPLYGRGGRVLEELSFLINGTVPLELTRLEKRERDWESAANILVVSVLWLHHTSSP